MSSNSLLHVLDAPSPESIPDTPEAFLRELGGPAWIRVPGRDGRRTRAVSTLLHGNEPSGLRAVHAWLRRGETPAVDTVFLLGAVAAALHPPGFAHRQLPGYRDLNRCFLDPGHDAMGQLAHAALARLRESRPEALVDLHNNTGHNPPYGVGPSLGRAELGLVSLFGHRYVHSDLRLGALVEATAGWFPSVVIECGRAGDPVADALALEGIERYLELAEIQEAWASGTEISVLVDPIRVSLRPGLELRFGDRPDASVDFTVDREIDRHNFEELAPGVPVGWLSRPGTWPIEATGASGRDVSRDLFDVEDGVLRTRRPVMPIMMTTDPGVATSDCLFYLVRRSSS